MSFILQLKLFLIFYTFVQFLCLYFFCIWCSEIRPILLLKQNAPFALVSFSRLQFLPSHFSYPFCISFIFQFFYVFFLKIFFCRSVYSILSIERFNMLPSYNSRLLYFPSSSSSFCSAHAHFFVPLFIKRSIRSVLPK